MSAHLARIERVNPKINAIVTLVADRAMADAAKADEQQAHGRPLGPLHGLPVAHKDLVPTAGIRTTFGSPFYKDNVPTKDALIVTRIRAAGAITLGKTNTPEFGAGSNTFNPVFGATHNPYNLAKTVGGSSGGAAASLTTGMVPIADGSDTGGSLRNPAAWNNVVGFRPSPGRVPHEDGTWSPLSTSGPMARTVADVALFLSAIAGPLAADPLTIDEDPARFRAPLARVVQGRPRGVVQGPRRTAVRARDHARRQRESPCVRAARLRGRGRRAGFRRRGRRVSDHPTSLISLELRRAGARSIPIW